MTDILLNGCNGRMGKMIVNSVKNDGRYRIAAGVDVKQTNEEAYYDFPVFRKLADYTGSADVIIDFNNDHTKTEEILLYAESKKLPDVIATTGHTEDEINTIKKFSRTLPIFSSGNMSLGINLLSVLIKKAASVLGADFDVEIIEKHHNQKLDAPSGTALMLADALSGSLPFEPEYIYDRHSERKTRDKKEIGIHSIRGGTIIGEHEVIFAGKDEVITISHSAASREIFAAGALRAAEFIINKPAGMYNMNDLLNE